MKVLVACEFSGVVRDAFRKKGHNAWSCDLVETDNGLLNHVVGNVLDVIDEDWDMLIAFPPCCHLAVSGAKHFREKQADGRQQKAIVFFMQLALARIPRVCVENPIGIMSTCWRKPDQIVQPYWFGHNVPKSTCLWLKGLPKLEPTNMVDKGEYLTFPSGKRMSKWYADKPFGGDGRKKIRSTTFQGIADAMADQWG